MMGMNSEATSTAATLLSLCDDMFFAVTAARRLEIDDLRTLASRRSAALATTLRGGPRQGIEAWEPWLFALCAAIAPISPPHWLPMAGAVDAGLSLEHGARGFRALFTSEPSEKNVARVRALGSIAVRCLGAVLGADGTFTREERVIRGSLIASLGLPEQDRLLLDVEPPLSASSLDVPIGIESKIARSIVRGSYYAAMSSGIDPREEAAVEVLSQKLGLSEGALADARAEAREMIDTSKPFGEATTEAVLYMLEGDVPAREMLGFAAMRLTLPPVHQIDSAKAITVGFPVHLAAKHSLDREHREAVLALGWIAAVRGNPTYARRAELAVRHDRIAADLGELAEGRAVREATDRHIDIVLCALLEQPARPPEA